MSSAQSSSIQSILQHLAGFAKSKSTANKTAWSYLDEKGAVVDSYTYKELDHVTTSLAIHLAKELNVASRKPGEPGVRVLLVFFPGLAFTVSLLACFKAGIIAVPVFPPDPRKLKKDLRHFISTQGSSGASVALTNDDYNFAKNVADIKRLLTLEDGWPEIKWMSIDSAIKAARKSCIAGESAGTLTHIPANEDIAFLQYTSGSTSEPKGVMISHRSLSHNLMLIIRELKADETTINVSWLPQYHDMGLIGSYLGVIYCGGTGYYLSPITFLKEPLSWIRAMSTYRCTHTQAPNFAYALSVRKFHENYDKAAASDPNLFDLSSLRHMINAAEPIDVETLRDFYTLFRKYKLPQGVVFPTYGLAEHTVFVCSGGEHVLKVTKASIEASAKIEIVTEDIIDNLVNTKAAEGISSNSSSGGGVGNSNVNDSKDHIYQWIVGCGYPSRGENVNVIIVASRETTPSVTKGADGIEEVISTSHNVVEEGNLGEVWVTSPSKASGYWGLADLSRDDFHARLSTEMEISSSGGSSNSNRNSVEYLKTGDLGFMHNGELFICGRLKDLIIVRGSNHYPQDIERTAEKCTNFLRPGCSAAFSIKHTGNSTESIVLVAELKDNVKASRYGEIIEKCRTVVSAEHGLSLTHIVLLKTRSIPKTTSGKIARSWCRRAFLESSLQVQHKWSGTAANAPSPDLSSSNASIHTAPTPTIPSTGLFAVDISSGDDINDNNSNSNSNTSNEMQNLMMPSHSMADQRETMNLSDIEESIEVVLRLLTDSGQGGIHITAKDRIVSLAALGLDSMTLVQLKGVLEKRFFCELPDEFFYQPFCCVKEISLAVKNGGLMDKQKALIVASQSQIANVDGVGSSGGAGKAQTQVTAGGGGTGNAVTEEQVQYEYKAPICPWFMWCC